MTEPAPVPDVPTGTFKTFGAYGIPYRVETPIRQLDDGDWMVKIRLLESNEITEYRLSKLLNDPDAL